LRLEIQDGSDFDDIAKQLGVAQDSLLEQPLKPATYTVADVPSIFSLAHQTIDFIVEGLLAAGTVTMVTGDAGSGKSTFLSAIGSAVEQGIPFAGLATQRRPVLILDRENPGVVVIERFNRLGIRDSENFKVWGGWNPEEPPAPGSQVILSWVKACEPKPLIIVDSFVAFSPHDENSATETRAYMNQFRALADAGATIAVIHHLGKGGQDYRGSSDIPAGIDVGLRLDNLGDSARLSALRLRSFKARFLIETAIFQYHEGVFRIDGRAPTQTVQEKLRELLIANPGIKTADFEEMAIKKGVARGRIREALGVWVQAGNLRVAKGIHNAKYLTWIEGGSVHESEFLEDIL
jgi:archaellum biogenesis ATPase FlaH